MGNVLSIHFSALVKADICLSLSVTFDDNEEHIIVEYSLPNLSTYQNYFGICFRTHIPGPYLMSMSSKY